MATLDLNTSNFTDPIVKGMNRIIPLLPSVIVILLVGVLVVRVVSRALKFVLTLTNVQQGLRDVIVSTVEILLWLLLSIAILQALGFNNIIVFFSSSVFAIGLLLSAGGSTLISDVVAGIFLARDVDFSVGDEVIVGETPTRGIIESMDARRTRLRDADGMLHVLPNSTVERKEWVLVHKRQELTPLIKAVKTARKLGIAAVEKRAAVQEKRAKARKMNQ